MYLGVCVIRLYDVYLCGRDLNLYFYFWELCYVIEKCLFLDIVYWVYEIDLILNIKLYGGFSIRLEDIYIIDR